MQSFMTKEIPIPLQVVAMHGWGCDARTWEAWRKATEPLGWHWREGERGYGRVPPRIAAWPEPPASGEKRLVIGCSLGPHLVPADVLARAGIVVLLSSFSAFVPPGREGRRSRTALAGMAASLQDETRARAMLQAFTAKIAEPQSPDLLPLGPLDGPLAEVNRARLLADLDLLAKSKGLPAGFPPDACVLIVEGEEDGIVGRAARVMLREALPSADVITLPGVGHALLSGHVIDRVVEWVEACRRAKK